MFNRRILLTVLSILCVGGVIGSYGAYANVRGQFGWGGNTDPMAIPSNSLVDNYSQDFLDAACGSSTIGQYGREFTYEGCKRAPGGSCGTFPGMPSCESVAVCGPADFQWPGYYMFQSDGKPRCDSGLGGEGQMPTNYSVILGKCDATYRLQIADCQSGAPVKTGDSCQRIHCCDNSSFKTSWVFLPCEDPQATCSPTPSQGYICWKPSYPSSASSTSSDYSSSAPSSAAPSCGNGVKEGNEECDDGSNNIPSGSGSVSQKEFEKITPADADILKRSSCLDTCKKAQCSDGKDNDSRNNKDDLDFACHSGPNGESTYLPGYDNESCARCERADQQDDQSRQISLVSPSDVMTATVLPIIIGNAPAKDEYKYYCRGGFRDLNGNACECGNGIRMLDGPDGEVKCADVPSDAIWKWQCAADDDCEKGYRCAWYSALHGVDLFRCKKMIEEGDIGCRSRWDCVDNYKDPLTVGNDGMLMYKNPTPFKCIARNTSDQGKCCGPDTDECKRTAFQGQTGRQMPQAPQCQTPPNGGFPGLIGGGDGGGDSGDGGNGGDGSTGGGSAGSANSSSSSACNIHNPCLSVTLVNGRTLYTIPPTCPVTGNKRTCLDQCIAGINRTGQYVNCMAQCSIRDSDLNMCPCNTDWPGCASSCVDDFVSCKNLCAYDNNPTACRTQCTLEYQQCVPACGRSCPNSSQGSVGNPGSSRASVPASSNGSSTTSGRSSSHSSSSRSSSSNSQSSNGGSDGGSGGSNGSNGSQGSNGSNQSGKSSTKSGGSSTSSVCPPGYTCMTKEMCLAKGGTNNGAANVCGDTTTCCKLPSSSSHSGQSSSRSGGSANSSASSIVVNGVCCEAGNCNPFGSCSNPFPNYNACKAECGESSSSRSSSSSSSSISSSSRSSSSSSSHIDSSSSTSRSSYSSSSSSSSNSSHSSSSRSSSSSSSYSSAGNGDGGTISGTTGIGGGISGTTGIGGTSGDTTAGIGGATGGTTKGDIGGNGGIGGEGDSCTTDRDCAGNLRCILGRCLTPTDVAQLPAFCGNARLDRGEECDDGSLNSDRPNATCRPDCTVAGCGDGIIDTPLEQCDDGNTFNSDGCSATCLPERTAPTTTLPATTVELPFTNKGDLGSIGGEDVGADNSGGTGGMNGGSVPSSVPSTPDTGPAALAVMLAGGAAGWLYRRRK